MDGIGNGSEKGGCFEIQNIYDAQAQSLLHSLTV